MNTKLQQDLAFWDYIARTGKCPTCHAVEAEHPQCAACGIYCGMGHEDSLSTYRRYKLCGRCIAAWKRLDRIIKRHAAWEEFLRSDKLFFFPKADEYKLKEEFDFDDRADTANTIAQQP